MKFLDCVKTGSGCLVKFMAMIGCCVVLAFFAILVVSVAIVAMMSDADTGCNLDGCESEKPLEKKWIRGNGDEDAPKVVYVRMRGIITATMNEGLFAEELSDYAHALRSIRAATRDKAIRGIVIRLDTPGGTVTDSDVMADALRRFKTADEGRFVLAFMGSMCCSGGYYVAAGADYIIANPTTLTGSIGVIMAGYNAAELAKKIGVKSVVVASGANKALLDPLVPVNPEHVAILKRPVEQDYARFVSIVASGRKLSVDEVKKVADGRILSAQDAMEAKLVDSVGYEEDVWKKAAELAGAEDVRVYRYARPFSWMDFGAGSFFMKCGRAFFDGVASGVDAPAPLREYRLR